MTPTEDMARAPCALPQPHRTEAQLEADRLWHEAEFLRLPEGGRERLLARAERVRAEAKQ